MKNSFHKTRLQAGTGTCDWLNMALTPELTQVSVIQVRLPTNKT